MQGTQGKCFFSQIHLYINPITKKTHLSITSDISVFEEWSLGGQGNLKIIYIYILQLLQISEYLLNKIHYEVF